MNKKEYIKAASLLDVYARSDNISRDYLLLRSQLQHYWNRNNNAAIATIEDAIKRYGEDKEIINFAMELASITEGLVGGKNAGELASMILLSDSQNIFALKIYVGYLIRNSQWQQAYDSCVKLLSINENADDDIIYNYIDICLELKKNDEAWNQISKLYLENPQNENVIQEYVKVLVALKRNSEALQIIELNLPVVNSRTKSFLYYEKSFIVTNDDDIFSALRSSLTSNPRNTQALFRLYSIYFSRKDYRKAQYYLKQVIALNPTNKNYYENLNSELDGLINR